MKRDIYKELVRWKWSERRKPLILKGARQTGKTYILKEFAKEKYENYHYFNFEEESGIDDIFVKDLNPYRIIEDICLYRKTKINPETDLIIFDEIQASNNALNSLKYFNEKANHYHIAAAGSLLGIKLSKPKSFPVGKVNFLQLYPMTFFEFLDGMNEPGLRKLIENTKKVGPYTNVFHDSLIELLKKYYYTGGMPEAVDVFRKKGNMLETREVQKEILNSYVLDFAKHAPANDIPKLSSIWNSIPKQLGRENKKFIFSAVRPSARAREYEGALNWLEDAGLIYSVYNADLPRIPLKSYINDNNFKVYLLDIGLLGTMADVPVEIISNKYNIFTEFKGAFVENYAAETLTASFKTGNYFWKREKAAAEIDFLLQINSSIYPLEVKAGINTKSKSLQSYNVQYSPNLMIRSNLLNLKKDGSYLNIPLYALGNIQHICSFDG